MGLEEHVAAWSAVHGGLAPSPLVRRYLRVVHAVAEPVARTGVHPDLLTLLALGVALPVLWVPAPVAAVLVLVSALLDALDGGVALLQGRPTPWGYVLDSVVDRLCEGLFLAALLLAGAPLGLAVACGSAIVLLEYTRARAGNAGGDEVGTVTVAERPVRVLLPVSGLLLDQPAVALWGLAALTAVGLAQLLLAVRRQLTA
ncbi:MAG TPA: CDP-alcohol phosphatidyltransferase family protein [Mycobacteriales bacterium]|nr:CDP-alcohol phosphatidyltransferase family protein [Mycobacteriales bacterium]